MVLSLILTLLSLFNLPNVDLLNNERINQYYNLRIYNKTYYELRCIQSYENSELYNSFILSMGRISYNKDSICLKDIMNNYDLKGLFELDTLTELTYISINDSYEYFKDSSIVVSFRNGEEYNETCTNISNVKIYKSNVLLKANENYGKKKLTLKYGVYSIKYNTLEYKLEIYSNGAYKYYFNNRILSEGDWKIKQNLLFLNENKNSQQYILIIINKGTVSPVYLPLLYAENIKNILMKYEKY